MYAEHGQAANASALASQLGLDLSRLVLSSPEARTKRRASSAGEASAGVAEVEAAGEARLKATHQNCFKILPCMRAAEGA